MKNFQKYLKQYAEFGTVTEVRYPLIIVDGLPNAHTGELVWFDTDEPGYVQSLSNRTIQVALLGNNRIRPGQQVARSGQQVEIPVGSAQRGQIINPLGQPLLTGATLSGSLVNRAIDSPPPNIGARAQVSRPFLTGSSVVDLFVPLGAGQREAIFGDQKTGKTSFLLAAARAHANHGIVVYAIIGRPWSDIKRIYDFMREEATTQQNMIIVASSANDVPSLITLTPQSAMTIAEYWRDAGHDVLLILHDLSTHAKFYREIALIAGRFPGRESYPGDIFYVHARLLERAGSFSIAGHTNVTITCLPVVETVRSDVTDHIVSNIISITDGHILFDPTRYSQGLRPAVLPQASVTRVGLKVQTKLAKGLHQRLLAFLGKYDQAQKYGHFGTELSEELKQTKTIGDRLSSLMTQPAYLNVPFPVQLIITTIVWQGWLNAETVETASAWRERLLSQYLANAQVAKTLDQLVEAANIDQFIIQLNAQHTYLTDLCHTEKILQQK